MYLLHTLYETFQCQQFKVVCGKVNIESTLVKTMYRNE